MKADFIAHLRCPVCRGGEPLDLTISDEDHGEVRTGTVTCRSCGAERGIDRGIINLLPEQLPGFVQKETAGLDRFADHMRADGWDRARILNLPYEPDGHWFAQATCMHQVLHAVPFEAGQTILDVGSNTCWASAKFAEHGLRAIALDINASDMQGLGTADWWREDKGLHMERVLGLMFDLPFADDSLDWVWCCEVLHHNHRENLDRTMTEIHRVLRPGGSLIAVNEPMRSLKVPLLRPGEDVAQFEAHEHAYIRRSYVQAAKGAGFDVQVRGSWGHPLFQEDDLAISRRMTTHQALRVAGFHALRRNRVVRKVGLGWLTYVRGGIPLVMLARK